MDTIHKNILSIFTSAVKSVLPRQLIKDNLKVTNDKLTVSAQLEITLNKNLHVVGFGKATLAMASAVEDSLHNHVMGGVISIPIGTQNSFKHRNQIDCLLRADSKIEIYEGAANNLPDDNSLQAANRIVEYLETLGSNDVVLVLISGGGSALLPSPIQPLTLEDKQKTIQLLTSQGATIQELNIVRKQLSSLKGGGLATHAKSSRIISLILSDIIGDPIDLIASGPTVVNKNTPNDALEILERLNLQNDIPASVIEVLNSRSKNPPESIPIENVTNIVIGNNSKCLSSAKSIAGDLGYATIVLTSEFDGEARKAGELLAKLAHKICIYLKSGDLNALEAILSQDLFKKVLSNKRDDFKNILMKANLEKLPVCILTGGETTVIVKNKDGVGGRNQELVLSCAICLDKIFTSDLSGSFNVLILSAGTDGIDGPTTAAGALTDLCQSFKAIDQNLDMDNYLERNDSNSFYKLLQGGKDLVVIGHTGTNVMDVQIMLIASKVKV